MNGLLFRGNDIFLCCCTKAPEIEIFQLPTHTVLVALFSKHTFEIVKIAHYSGNLLHLLEVVPNKIQEMNSTAIYTRVVKGRCIPEKWARLNAFDDKR